MLARNLLPALVPLLVAIAIGVTLPAARRLGARSAPALFAYSLGFCVWAGFSPDLQRPDWDTVAARIGEPQAPRATVTWVLGEASLRYYLSTGAIQVSPPTATTGWSTKSTSSPTARYRHLRRRCSAPAFAKPRARTPAAFT